MKAVKQKNNSSVDWLNSLRRNNEKSEDGNFIYFDDEICTGTNCVLSLEDGITAILSDKLFKMNFSLKYRNLKSNFVGLYFFITDKNIEFNLSQKDFKKERVFDIIRDHMDKEELNHVCIYGM